MKTFVMNNQHHAQPLAAGLFTVGMLLASDGRFACGGPTAKWKLVISGKNRTYFLERSTTASSGFTPVATGILGRPGTTTYTDTNAIGAGPWFYRVGVSAR